MFMPFAITSVNKVEQLAGQLLGGTCTEYQLQDGSRALVFEYEEIESGKMVACDVLVCGEDDQVYAHDYLLLNDDRWRNSFGEFNLSLINLIPESLLKATRVSSTAIEMFKVEV